MSNWREQLSEESEAEAMMTLLERYYHIPVLVVLVGFMLWNRLRNYGNFIIDGTIYLSGNDPWYHLRMTEYTVANFPSTMPFDPFTNFPHGTTPDQFGTLFDQLIALVALVLGLGSPNETLVREVFLVAPPFIALLAAIPGYFIGKRLGGRVGGLVVVGVIAFIPDRLMEVTIAGNVQHHGMEVLFMTLSVLGVMVALSHAEREKPVWELVSAREFGAMRNTIGYSMLAGLAMAMYVWTWPPGMWIFGILSIFFIVHMSIEHVRGNSPEHTAFVGIISMATAAALVLGTTRTLELTSVTARSLLQPGLAIGGVVGIVFLAWLSRALDSRQLPRVSYPGAVAGSMVLTLGFLALVLPDIFDFLVSQLDRVLIGFLSEQEGGIGTIGETRQMSFAEISDIYQLGIFTAGVGGGVLLLKQVLGRDPSAEELLLVVWALLMVMASLTQLRFSYYLTIVVGALNAALVGFVFDVMGTDREFEFETYQVLTVAVIVVVVFAPFLGLPIISADQTPTEFVDQRSAPGDVVAWDDSLQFMNENTPAPGQFAHPDSEPMELFGAYEETDSFDYQAGAYGVMSWWDYGHWITQRGERIPNANPFQEGATEAAEFLLAQDEDEALEALAEVDDHDDAQTRFVMIDGRMVETESGVGGKFFAPPVFHDDYQEADFTRQYLDIGDEGMIEGQTRLQRQAYHESMMVRLYHYHGSAHEPEPVVVEWRGEENVDERGQGFVEAAPEGERVQAFDTLAEAREYVDESPSAQIGGLGAMPEERVGGLEHFRLVHLTETWAIPPIEQGPAGPTLDDHHARMVEEHGVNIGPLQARQSALAMTGLAQEIGEEQAQMALNPTTPSFTKTFERVPGATIEGTGPENEIVEISVEIEPENGEPFTYRRETTTDDDGAFELVVPYSTTGADEFGVEEGYTEPAVEAASEYEFRLAEPEQTEDGELFVWRASEDVTEAQVIGEDPDPVEVELEREELAFDDVAEDENGDANEDEQGGADGNGEAEGGADEDGGTDRIGGVDDASTLPPTATG